VSRVVVYYHDPVEVNPATSWTGLCPPLKGASLVNIRGHKDPRVTALFEYARPDAVITLDGQPIVSIEQTAMNPSGHNIPQRFSFHLCAAELGVPSILYYPEYSRRTFSDPGVRYVQVRVPLAQQRLSQIYNIPALSVFWPTNPTTLLPDTAQTAHQNMADVVGALVTNAGNRSKLLSLPEIKRALSEMDRVVARLAGGYAINPSVRALLPNGFASSRTRAGIAIDPPTTNTLFRTPDFLRTLAAMTPSSEWPAAKAQLQQRDLTMVFTGTANKSRTDSEHPWPGYLTLLDTLYARRNGGLRRTDRDVNLIYRLPVNLSTFVGRVNKKIIPTATYIADTFSDLIILNGGVIAGRTMRGNIPVSPLLT
jgi:hypothetical protein